jgi:hypothetical protein
MDGSLNEAERPEQSPATASQARPVTLSVVIDGRLDAARARQVAVLTHRLGLAGAWLRYPWWPLRGSATGETEPAGLLAALAVGVPVPLGLLVDADAADLAGADGAWLDRLVTDAGSPAAGTPDAGLPVSPRIALAGSPPAVARWRGLIARRPGLPAAPLALPAAPLALPAAPLARPGADGGASEPAAAVFVPCAPGRDLAAEVAAAAAAVAGRPVLAEVTVSVGRTAAEARARADADELFTLAGHPADQGLFGTLEECQATAARLAQAGATELVCYLPLASDLPDVLAQLRSIAIGASMLRPGEPPSAAPPPPAGWGGRRFTA